MKKAVIIFLALAVVIAVFAYTAMSAGVFRAQEPTPSQAAPAPTPNIEAPKVGKLKVGGVVSVTGTVTEVTVNLGSIWVTLQVPGKPGVIECIAELGGTSYNTMRYMKVGEEVTVRGKEEYVNETLTLVTNCQ